MCAYPVQTVKPEEHWKQSNICDFLFLLEVEWAKAEQKLDIMLLIQAEDPQQDGSSTEGCF